MIDGLEPTGLSLGEEWSLADRDVLLFGVFADGTAFQLDLNQALFSRSAILKLTLVEAPVLDGDYNSDGVVDAADYSVWRDGLGIAFTQDDYAVWRDNYGVSASTPASGEEVPEPATIGLISLALLAWIGLFGRT